MLTKAELRNLLRERLDQTIVELNHALQGVNLERLEPVLLRFGRGQTLPHWYEQLNDQQTLPNNEWNRLLVSPLNGQIGMSFALQWRYNFARVFRDN